MSVASLGVGGPSLPLSLHPANIMTGMRSSPASRSRPVDLGIVWGSLCAPFRRALRAARLPGLGPLVIQIGDDAPATALRICKPALLREVRVLAHDPLLA